MGKCLAEKFTKEEKDAVLAFIAKQKGVEGALIPVLHEVQEHFGYIPYEAQVIMSEEMNIPLSDIYGVVTFYSRFTLKPTGDYKVSVCLGTACYVKGSEKVLERVEKTLGIKAGETSADGKYSIEATRCVGACGLAPIMTVNDDVYGKMTAEQVDGILEKYK